MKKKRSKQRFPLQKNTMPAAQYVQTLPDTRLLKESTLITRKSTREFATPVLLEERKVARNSRIILLFSIIGMITATYLTYNHYTPDVESFCSLSQTINCDIVNKSLYAELFGIPVAILGFLAYLALAVSGLLLLKYVDLQSLHYKLTNQHIHWLIFFIAIVGFGFSTWLTYVEWQILKTWCPLCVLSYILLTGILIFSIANIELDHRCQKKKQAMKAHSFQVVSRSGKVCEFC